MRTLITLLIALLLAATNALAQAPDTVLVNGNILTVDERSSTQQAIAIRDGRILAVGTTADIRKLAGPSSRVIDLEGRTVIPGLIDSHLHGLRAGTSFATEVNWVGAASISEALQRIRDAARAMKPGSWLIVAGGWNAQQFKEQRRPTQSELADAAPSNPVYVQLGYTWAMLTQTAYKALNIASETDLTGNGRFETDAAGKRTGAVTGPQEAIIMLFDRLPKPTFDEQVEGTKKFFRELNRLGLTGFVDPGGNNLFPSDYQAVLKIWRDGLMSARVAYSLNGQTAGSEFEDLKNLTQLLPIGFGDDILRFNGIGERITFGMYNNDRPGDADKAKYYEILKWAAERGMILTMHWNRDASVNELLTLFEKVNKEVPITGLRWSIAHLNDASEASLARMKALGMGWTVQPAGGLRGSSLETGRRMDIHIGAGTDAHRVASYNPFTALQSLLERPDGALTRANALRFYTIGSAWFSRDETKRGSLEVGKIADLAVLSRDYMIVPVDQVGSIESLLTMLGGKIVYAAGPYKALESNRP